MKIRLFILIFLGAVGITKAQQPFTIGETQTIYSKILGEERILNIYLPAYYSDTISYPVIYLLDGSADEDFVHVSGVMQFMNMMQIIPDAIIVGIANVDRKRDFCFPTTIEQDKKDYDRPNYPAVYGFKKAQNEVGRYCREAKDSISLFGEDARLFFALIDYVQHRTE